jgi:hypothetical protein
LAGTRLTDPEGGFLLWVELPAGVDATDVNQRALALGVRVVPGGLFSTGPAYDGYLRLSRGAPWPPGHRAGHPDPRRHRGGAHARHGRSFRSAHEGVGDSLGSHKTEPRMNPDAHG